MKAITVFYGDNANYKRMLNVFLKSGKENNLDIKILSPDMGDREQKRKAIEHFFDISCEWLLENDGDVGVFDSDLMILKPLDDVWSLDFDIAVTVRKTIPYNTGV